MKFMIERWEDYKGKLPPTQNSRLEGTDEKYGINAWSIDINSLEELLELVGEDCVIINRIENGEDINFCVTLADAGVLDV